MTTQEQTTRTPKGHLYTKEDLEILTGANILVIDQTPGLSWESDYNSFYLDGSNVPANDKGRYDILNPLTGHIRTYEFAECLGPQWDPRAELVYVDFEGIELHVFNIAGHFGCDNIYAEIHG